MTNFLLYMNKGKGGRGNIFPNFQEGVLNFQGVIPFFFKVQ